MLIESGDWGVVRVLPEVLDSSELLVTGTILQSDGLRLQLRISARDASGVEWLNRVYSGSTRSTDYPVSVPGDPYLGLYQQIADDLAAVRRAKERKAVGDDTRHCPYALCHATGACGVRIVPNANASRDSMRFSAFSGRG